MLHIQTHHPEDGDLEPSPFVVREEITLPLGREDDDAGEDYIYCPVHRCGEALLLTELESHVDMHEQERDSEQESSEEGSSRSGKRLKLNPEFENSERDESFDTKLSYALRNLDDVDGKEEAVAKETEVKNSKSAWGQVLKMPASIAGVSPKRGMKRLGVSTYSSVLVSAYWELRFESGADTLVEIRSWTLLEREADARLAC